MQGRQTVDGLFGGINDYKGLAHTVLPVWTCMSAILPAFAGKNTPCQPGQTGVARATSAWTSAPRGNAP
ncbi:hypothetical protein BR1R5_40640 [Pseudomonas sp. BR1R-5]|nr:hypothetical protein BR1R5_40640 [Pseudomonas sp. BR1R-5]